MLPRERVRSMLETGQADRVPFTPCYFSDTSLYAKPPEAVALEEFSRRYPKDGAYELTPRIDAEVGGRAMRLAMEDMAERPDWIRSNARPFQNIYRWGRKVLVKRGDVYTMLNAVRPESPIVQKKWRVLADGSCEVLPFERVKSKTYWNTADGEHYANPASREDLDRVLFRRSADIVARNGETELVRAMADELGDTYMITAFLESPFWQNTHILCHLWGYEGLFTALCDTPDLVLEATERNLYNVIEEAKALKAAGLDIVILDEYMSSNDDIGPQHYEQFSLPFTRRAIEEIKKLGLYVVHEYGGDFLSRTKYLRELPADAFWCEEQSRGKDIDVVQVRKEMGENKVLIGNISNKDFLYRGTPERVVAEVKRQIDGAGRSGHFMMSTGSASSQGSIRENAIALLETTRTHRPAG